MGRRQNQNPQNQCLDDRRRPVKRLCLSSMHSRAPQKEKAKPGMSNGRSYMGVEHGAFRAVQSSSRKQNQTKHETQALSATSKKGNEGKREKKGGEQRREAMGRAPRMKGQTVYRVERLRGTGGSPNSGNCTSGLSASTLRLPRWGSLPLWSPISLL